MAEHTITLSESTYQSLIEEAQAKGISPDDWIAARLAATVDAPKLSSESHHDSVESSDSDARPSKSSKFITPTSEIQQKPLSELLSGLVGTVNSGAENRQTSQKADPYGDALAEKFDKQGIRLP